MKDARRCSYLGELDSNEEESDEISEEFEFEHRLHKFSRKTNQITSIPLYVQNAQQIENSDKTGAESDSNPVTPKNPEDPSKDKVHNFVDAFNGMNEKSKNDIFKKILQSFGPKNQEIDSKFDAGKLLKFFAVQSSKKVETKEVRKSNLNYQSPDVNKSGSLTEATFSKLKDTENPNSLNIENQNVADDGGEVFDEETNDGRHNNEGDDSFQMSNDIYDVMERGNFDQRQRSKKDGSREKNPEPMSSWSSSEEALMKCEGLLAFQQLNGSRTCTANDSESNNRDVMHEETITETGFYYFIFANENEITPNFMRVRFDLHKTVFDVSSNKENCTDTMKCILPLNFWSNDHVVLEIPENQPEYKKQTANAENSTASSDPCQDDSLIKGYSSHTDCHRLIVAETVCTPRKPIYMMFVLLAPILILCFAYI